jgi:hypothetical protein
MGRFLRESMPHTWRIEPSEVARKSGDDLKRIINQLLRAERRTHRDACSIYTSDRNNVEDEGVDGRVLGWASASRWIPAGESIWQCKGGHAKPTKAQVEKELKKPGVSKALRAGCHYAYVPSAELEDPQRTSVLELIGSAFEELYPEIAAAHNWTLLTASDVAEWATEHPVMLFEFNHPVAGFVRADQWLARGPDHRAPFQAIANRDANIEAILGVIDDPLLPQRHVRIQGKPGVGKTRLALETFSGRDEEDLVLFAPEPPSDPTLFSWMMDHEAATATLVVDECEPRDSAKLADLAAMGGGRLALITIGLLPSGGSTSGAHIINLELVAEEDVRKVLQGAFALSPEQTSFVARIALGDLRLAMTVAPLVLDGQVSLFELTSEFNVRTLLERLIPPDEGSRKVVRALSLMTRVGWSDEVEEEGRALMAFFEIPYGEARDIVGKLVARGVVARNGRYRYIRSEMMATWQAGQLWRERRDDLLAFIGELPQPAGDALRDRCTGLAGIPEAQEILDAMAGVRGPFASIEALDDERSASFFGRLANAAPDAAVETLQFVIGGASRERLLSFERGRRSVIWALERLAARRSTFFAAARVVRRLAESENETWGNNATGVWSSLFLTYLGGTEVPAYERYDLVQEALEDPDPAVRLLALAALNAALTLQEVGRALNSDGPHAPPKAWEPRTVREEQDSRRAALRLLDKLINDPDEPVRTRAREILRHSVRSLTERGLAGDVIERISALSVPDEDERREVWESLQGMLRYESAFLSDAERETVVRLADSLLGGSFHDRLRRYAGRWSHVDWPGPDEREAGAAKPEDKAAQLADEFIRDPALLTGEIEWLVSGKAENAWHLGRRLGELDESREFFNTLAEHTSAASDLRLLSAYLSGRANAGDAEWREELLDHWSEDNEKAALVFDATWRGASSERAAQRLVDLVERGALDPATIGHLAWGAWAQDLPESTAAALLSASMRDASPRVTGAGLSILGQWLQHHADQPLLGPLLSCAWELLSRGADASDSQMLSYEWGIVATRLLPVDAPRLAGYVVHSLSTQKLHLDDHRLAVLRAAAILAPDPVWDSVGAALLTSPVDRFAIGWRLRDSSFIDAVPLDTLKRWLDDHGEAGGKAVAELVVPHDELQPVVALLLDRFGGVSEVAAMLRNNFLSGAFWGSLAARDELKLGVAKRWRDGAVSGEVRLWAQAVGDSIEESLPRARLMEEEGDWDMR